MASLKVSRLLPLAAARKRRNRRTPRLRVVTLRNYLPTVNISNSTRAGYISRSLHTVAQPATTLVMSFTAAQLVGPTYPDGLDIGNDIPVLDMAVEGPGGTIVQVTKNGLGAFTIPNGAFDWKVDPVPASAFGLTEFPEGWEFVIKFRSLLAANGHKIPATPYRRSLATGTQSAFYDPAVTTVSSTLAAGNYSVTNGGPALWNEFTGMVPVVLGMASQDKKSAIGTGDSIFEQVGDGRSTAKDGLAMFQLALRDAQNRLIPGINVAKEGTSYSMIAGSRWKVYLQYARILVDEMGTNSIGSSGAGDLQTLKDNAQAHWAAARAAGIEKIIRTHLICYTSSTDNWLTAANQTPISQIGWGAGGKAELFNQFVDEQRALGAVDAVATFNALRDPGNPRLWRTNGSTPKPFNDDGAHPNTAGHTAAGQEIRACIDALVM